MNVLSVDLGVVSGAIAISDDNGVRAYDMPRTPLEIQELVYSLKPDLIVCEDVGHSMPGNSAHSAYVFAVHRGHLEMIFLNVKPKFGVIWVRPIEWMRGFGIKSGLSKKERKEVIYRKVQMIYGDIVSRRNADALALLYYVLNKKEVMYGWRKEDIKGDEEVGYENS